MPEYKKPSDISPIINKTKKVEIKTTPIKGRYYQKAEEQNKNFEQNGKRVSHGKEFEIEKDEVKESIREMNRKKNYTHKPKNFNYSLDEIEYEQKNGEQVLSLAHINTDRAEEEKKGQQKIFYLYGIDRNDVLHIFDVNNKKWEEMKKIADIKKLKIKKQKQNN